MSEKVICKNKAAFFNYEIVEKFEAGLVLVGSEVKAMREGKANLSDSYANVIKDELWLIGAHISHYVAANQFNHEEKRERKLLMKRKEIDRLLGKIREKGLTLVPIRLYFKNGRVKLELGLGRGKKQHDKRETTKKRETDREIRRIKKHTHRM